VGTGVPPVPLHMCVQCTLSGALARLKLLTMVGGAGIWPFGRKMASMAAQLS
jgi:hypothetical protein